MQRLLAGMEALILSTHFVPAHALTWRTVALTLPLRTDPGYTSEDDRCHMENPKKAPGAWIAVGAIPVAFIERIQPPSRIEFAANLQGPHALFPGRAHAGVSNCTPAIETS
jgi:hypothetical protein